MTERQARPGSKAGDRVWPAGVSKTTLAKALEAELRAVRLSADDWMMGLSINLHDEAARAKMEALQWQLAKRLLENVDGR